MNIDATPGSMEEFRRLRSEDVNIECLVSADDAPYTLYRFDEPALATVPVHPLGALTVSRRCSAGEADTRAAQEFDSSSPAEQCCLKHDW